MESATCVECDRTFELCTELQRKRGEFERGWLCPTCGFNETNKSIPGFVPRPVKK